MQTPFRRWVKRGIALGVGVLVAGLLLVGLRNGEPPKAPPLALIREGVSPGDAAEGPGPSQRTNVVPDGLGRKFDPRVRVEFRASTAQDVAIFVEATGIQVETQFGWKIEEEEQRGEIWRMKAGVPREVCVGRPPSGAWRAFVRYGTELKGWPLFKAQLREAWLRRSFSNWKGQAWGGGRWGGSHLLVSEVFEE